jgi:hypothetical protein
VAYRVTNSNEDRNAQTTHVLAVAVAAGWQRRPVSVPNIHLNETISGHDRDGACAVAFVGHEPASSWRAAASAVSSGRVLNAIVAPGAALWTALTTISNRARLFGGILRPPPITTQSYAAPLQCFFQHCASGLIGCDHASVALPSAFSDLRNGDGNAGIDLLRIEAWRQGGVGEVYGFGLLANKQYKGQLLSPFTRFRTIAAREFAKRPGLCRGPRVRGAVARGR